MSARAQTWWRCVLGHVLTHLVPVPGLCPLTRPPPPPSARARLQARGEFRETRLLSPGMYGDEPGARARGGGAPEDKDTDTSLLLPGERPESAFSERLRVQAGKNSEKSVPKPNFIH